MSATQLPIPIDLPPLKTDQSFTSRTVRQARANGSANRLAPEDAPAHDWYRFVLSFPPHLVRDYLDRFSAGPDGTVLDPFCGTGTTLVECKKLGIPSVGIEAHPMAHFAASTKIDWTPNGDAILDHARRVARSALRTIRGHGLDDAPGVNTLQASVTGLLDLPPESRSLLLANSISDLPLHKTLVLLECLNEEASPSFDRHERLALARAVVSEIGNLHFGPEVGVGRIKEDAQVIAPWLGRMERMARDLPQLRDRAGIPANAVLGDSRALQDVLAARSISAVITSPPYPNEKDYTRTTRLESVLLGFITNRQQLRSLKKSFVRSNTRSVYKGDGDDAWALGFPRIAALAEEIESRRLTLGKTSGFERMYPRVTLNYFGGMARHFESLRESLKPGAMLAYVVGDQASYLRVMIKTGELLSEIAGSLGYEVLGLDLFRTRLATATRDQLREEVLVLRWPG